MSSALLIIDMQEAFFRTFPRPGAADRTVARINAAISRARDDEVPVIFIQHETVVGIPAHGSAEWALVQELDVKAVDHRIRKTTPDSFLRTGLDTLLQTLGVSRLIVCGYATEFCVDTTVRRAAGLGYGVTLVEDAHTTHDKAHAGADQIRVHHNATLSAITSFGVKIHAVSLDRLDFRSRD